MQRVFASGEGKELPYSTLEATAEAILDEELTSREEIHTALASLATATADPRTVIGLPRTFQAWARRAG